MRVRRRIVGKVAVVAGAGALLAAVAPWSPSLAQTASPVCFSASTAATPISPDPVAENEIVAGTTLPALSLTQFDPALGTLTGATLTVTLSATQDVSLFNNDLAATSATVTNSANATVSSAAGLSGTATANLLGTASVPALDFASVTIAGSGSGSASSASGSTLAALTGTGTTSFDVTAAAGLALTVPSSVIAQPSAMLATVTAQVCYAFVPVAATTTAPPTTVAATTVAPTIPGSTLPSTGASGEGTMTWMALALVAAGGALLVVARRRGSST